MNLKSITIMSAVLTAAVTLCIVSSALAFDEDMVPFSDRFPVEITVDDHSSVYELARLGIDIDAAGDGWVRAYVNQAELERVEELGYEVTRIPNQALRMWRSLKGAELKEAMATYHDYDAVTAFLQGVVADHPGITRLVRIGQSVQGRELWFLKITDNPDTEEDEPEFKYVATMHGDEPVGTENCIQFIDLLTDNYDSAIPDEDLKRLVDEVEIWIMPMMNPDGNTAGSRYNANGEDLNRSFPDWVDDPVNTTDGREPEVATMMVFSDSMAFDLSANFHTGALVVNYPSDNRPARAPDDSLFIAMSEAYSIHNSPMWNSPSFYHGITNGHDWYEIHGGMQDWNYDWMHNMEVTIELNDEKWPPASDLEQLWDDNDEAMAAYLEYCLRGIRGVVTDSLSAEPLPATVTVEGNGWDDRTDPDVGDYHRILDPGAYDLTFSSAGYLPKTFVGVSVSGDLATVLDVELAMAPLVTVSGTVTAEDASPLEARVEVYYHPGGLLADSMTTDPVDGSYSLVLAAGEYDFEVRASGFVPELEYAHIESDTTFDFVLSSTSGAILVIDDNAGAADIASDLVLMGFAVVEESAASSDPMTWGGYDLVVSSSGANTSPVSSSSYRSALIDYAAGGGLLLNEAGEVAYDAVSSPGYPDFADSVLHCDQWNGDNVGQLELSPAQTAHPVTTSPNALPATIGLSYNGYGSEDAAHPSSDAYIVFGTASEPSDAGVLVFDDPSSGGEGQIVFFAFAYSDVSDEAVAGDLLENAVTYLYDETAGLEGKAVGTSVVSLDRVRPNPFLAGTMVSFAVTEAQEIDLAIYDVQGRLIRTLLEGAVESGAHVIPWNGRDAGGSRLAPGIYFLRLSTPVATRVRKVVIQR